jgi:hypothetical protein
VRARARVEDFASSGREREFDLRRSSSPDVRGATRELPAAVDALVGALLDWLTEPNTLLSAD